MLLEISTYQISATDLATGLHADLDRVRTFALSGGRATVLAPSASESACSFAVIVDAELSAGMPRADVGYGSSDVDCVSSVGLAVSALLAHATLTAFRGAMITPASAVSLTARLLPVRVDAASDVPRRLFAPLGYAVDARPIAPISPAVGRGSPFVELHLSATCSVADLLCHLCTLIPVFDPNATATLDRHDLEAVLAKGAGWLDQHPERAFILQSYVRREGGPGAGALGRMLGGQLSRDGKVPVPVARDASDDAGLRSLAAALERVLLEAGAQSVVDLSCGDGFVLGELAKCAAFTKLIGVDRSSAKVASAATRLGCVLADDERPGRVLVMQGALTYRDRRIEGADALILVDMVPSLSDDERRRLARVVFEFARPRCVIIAVSAAAAQDGVGKAWSRDDVRAWADDVCMAFPIYAVSILQNDDTTATPAIMAVFQQ